MFPIALTHIKAALKILPQFVNDTCHVFVIFDFNPYGIVSTLLQAKGYSADCFQAYWLAQTLGQVASASCTVVMS